MEDEQDQRLEDLLGLVGREGDLDPVLHFDADVGLLGVLEVDPLLVIGKGFLVEIGFDDLVIVELAIEEELAEGLFEGIFGWELLQVLPQRFLGEFAEFLEEFDEFGY